MMTVGNLTRIGALAVLAGVIGFGIGEKAHAKQQDAIEVCAAKADAELRIKCLEEALRTSSAETVVAPDTEEAVPVAPVAPQPTPQAPVAPQVAQATPTTAPRPESPDLGAEQVAARASTAQIEREAQQARGNFAIASVEDIYPGKLRVTLQNGQVWQQIQGDTQRFDLDADDISGVEIWKSRWGGYKLRLTDQRRTLRVRRLR